MIRDLLEELFSDFKVGPQVVSLGLFNEGVHFVGDFVEFLMIV